MFNLQDFDPAVRPQDDFYQYANGGWLKNNQIPDDESWWGNFNILKVENTSRLKKLLEDLLNQNSPISSNFQRLQKFYSVAMDEQQVEQQGIQGIRQILDKINSLDSHEKLPELLAWLHKHDIDVFWKFVHDLDDKDSSKYTLRLYQGGLGMPDRDYYLKDDEKMTTVREEYKKHLARTFTLLGRDNPIDSAEAVYGLEHQLAKISWTRVQCRDVEAMYNPVTIENLAKQTTFNIADYFDQIGLQSSQKIINSQPDFFRVASELQNIQLNTIKSYLTFHVVSDLSPMLPQSFVGEHFSFYGKVITGTEKILPRWRRTLQIMNLCMEEPLGELYISKYFSPEAKRSVETIADDIFTAFKARLENLDWMSKETKQAAFKKLSTFKRKLGYPERFRDFSGLMLTDNYAENYLAVAEFDFNHHLKKLSEPVDKNEWCTGAHVVNAFYWPNMNDITFPAGVLQFPFFDVNSDPAENYGAIGMTIGHELTHGFDDTGSKFDENGNLRQWWAEDDRKSFDSLGKKLIAQYSACKIADDLYINGELTNGENIADLGGINIAFDAYQLYLDRAGKREKIDNLTPEQRFFCAYARKWLMLMRPEIEMMLATTDTHSPPRFRVNVPLSNMPAFQEAFNVKEGDAIYRSPEEQIKIW